MQDATTLFEMQVLKLLAESPEYVTRLTKPILIGPDRGTVQHTINTIKSYSPSMPTEKKAVRPDYRQYVDIVGTQARYVDNTATADNYLKLTKG